MNTHEKNEIVKKMREEFFQKYHDNNRLYEKIYTNIFFIERLIEDYGLEKVTQAGLTFLSKLKEDEISLLDNDLYGIPRNALRVLFGKALEAKLSGKMLIGLNDMFQRGNPNCFFIFEILKDATTKELMSKESMLLLEKLSKLIKKEKNDSWTSSSKKQIKREFIQTNEVVISSLLTAPKQPELFSQSH